jgi:hypothetical protein
MKVYECPTCNLAWYEDQVYKAFDGKAFCTQDGSPLRDISKTKRAKRLLGVKANNRKKEEE